MDGFDTSGDLVVIAASNLLDKLDPALLRPGRFDRQIFVSPPDVVGRKAILDVHTRNKPLAKDVDFEVIARQTSGLTGAELANICNEAAIAAARGLRPRVEHADFEYALERVVAGMETRHTLNERERRIVAFHEAGHALLAELLPGTTRTHRVSIVPRGTALGYVLHLPEEDRYLDTRAELMDELVVLLGGRAAEQLVFGSITSGASNDLFQVAAITRRMIHEWAMGTSVSAIQLSPRAAQVSDRTRELRDAEQQHLADEAMRRAVRLITEYRAQLDQLAGALLRQEVLEREDIERIMDGVAAPGAAPGPLRIAAPPKVPDRSSHASGSITRKDGRRRRLPRTAGARRDPRRVPADRPPVGPGHDRLRGPGALSHAARPRRAAARCDARRRGPRRPARRHRGRLLARDRRRRRPAPRAAAVGQPLARGARPSRAARAGRASCRRGS